MNRPFSGATRLTALVCCLGISGVAAQETQPDRAVRSAVTASGNLSKSAAQSIAASARATLAVSAVPLASGGVVLGSTGAASAAAARDSMRAANAPIGTPLEITDETIMVMPPNEALKPRDPAAR